MIQGIVGVDRELDGQTYTFQKLPNMQASEFLDELAAVLRPAFSKMPAITNDAQVIMSVVDRVLNIGTTISYKAFGQLAEKVFNYVWCGDIPLKGKFNAIPNPEDTNALDFVGRWDLIVKIVVEFIRINFSGFSKLLPSESVATLKTVRDIVARQLLATASTGLSGDPSKKGGPSSKKSSTSGPSTN